MRDLDSNKQLEKCYYYASNTKILSNSLKRRRKQRSSLRVCVFCAREYWINKYFRVCFFLWERTFFLLFFSPSENAKKNKCISSVLMSLELKMHTKNTHTHIHTRTNFQAHFDRETEDTRTKLSYFSCFFVCIFQKGEKNSHVFVTKSGQNDGA